MIANKIRSVTNNRGIVRDSKGRDGEIIMYRGQEIIHGNDGKYRVRYISSSGQSEGEMKDCETLNEVKEHINLCKAASR